jgi:hypothetical protein
LRYLIDAFEALPEEIAENSRLLIVGEAWEDRESLRLAMSSRRREKITIVNRYVPDSEVSLYFSASDVLVQACCKRDGKGAIIAKQTR